MRWSAAGISRNCPTVSSAWGMLLYAAASSASASASSSPRHSHSPRNAMERMTAATAFVAQYHNDGRTMVPTFLGGNKDLQYAPMYQRRSYVAMSAAAEPSSGPRATSTKNSSLVMGRSSSSSSSDSSSAPPPAPSLSPSDEDVERETLHWIRNVVVGLNLCPFAATPLREDRLKTYVVRGDDDTTIAGAVFYEMTLRQDKPGTTVVIAPECHPDDFQSYLSMLGTIEEEIMEEFDMHGKLQIAPFHPRFEFDGSGPDGVDNYTNRSPYPMFHILREEEVTLAVDKLGGDAGKVWERNVNLLQNLKDGLGQENVERIMRGEVVDGMEDIVRKVGEEIVEDDFQQ